MTIAFALIAASYLLGGVPTSSIVGRVARGIDLREHGSGNLGATNAFRVLGWRLAVPVLIVDVWKGWLPAFVFPRIDGAAAPELAVAYGGAAVLGHVFSVYVGFKGGKGVATGAGVFLALAPVAVLVGFVAWAVLVRLTRVVSLASIVAAAVLPVAVYASRGGDAVFAASLALAGFVVYAHRANIRRLLRGEEHRFERRGGEQ